MIRSRRIDFTKMLLVLLGGNYLRLNKETDTIIGKQCLTNSVKSILD